MIVVSNTTPLHYLILIQETALLEELFGRVLVPPAVSRELDRDEVPESVRAWMRDLPGWLEIHAVGTVDSELKLGAGEREAIIPAERRHADLLLLDDKDARRMAQGRGLSVTGTLGVLERAERQGLVDLPTAIERLQRTNFRATPAVFESVLRTKRP